MCLFTLKNKYFPKPWKTLNETSLGDPGKTFFVKNLKVSKTSWKFFIPLLFFCHKQNHWTHNFRMFPSWKNHAVFVLAKKNPASIAYCNCNWLINFWKFFKISVFKWFEGVIVKRLFLHKIRRIVNFNNKTITKNFLNTSFQIEKKIN